MDASLTGRVWDEFKGTYGATLVTNGPALELNATPIHGVFGEAVGQLNFRTKMLTGWSGYVSGGVKFNSDFTTTTAKGGVRYQW